MLHSRLSVTEPRMKGLARVHHPRWGESPQSRPPVLQSAQIQLNKIIEFTDDTAVVRLIDSNKSAYRTETPNSSTWCQDDQQLWMLVLCEHQELIVLISTSCTWNWQHLEAPPLPPIAYMLMEIFQFYSREMENVFILATDKYTVNISLLYL